LIGAVLGIFVTGMILKAHTVDAGTPTEKVLESGYITCFALYGIVYFAGVGLWLMIDASKPILAEDAIEAKA
jgi:hypothetical protein